MQFDPSTSTLFTDAGERIKTLHCPRKMQWTQLEPARDNAPHRHCQPNQTLVSRAPDRGTP
jgi:hypothetical protein